MTSNVSTDEKALPTRVWVGKAAYNSLWAMAEKPFALEGVEYVRSQTQWSEGVIELKRDGEYLVVSVERNGKYVEVIREYEPGGAPIGHAVHPSGIDSKLKEAGLL